MVTSIALMKTVKAAVVAMSVYAPQYTDSAHFLKESEVTCLARNLYHEARGEGATGMKLVAQTTRNRVYSGEFPSSYCGVVYERAQFSWTRKPEAPIADMRSWSLAVEIAAATIVDIDNLPEFRATHYYNYREIGRPSWPQRYTEVARHKNHVFLADMNGW